MASFFKGLKLDDYAKAKFGSNARVVCLDNHINGWRLELNGKQYNLDLNDAAQWQYGPGNRAVATGVYRDDWQAINFSQVTGMVIPVVVVASDKIQDINGVRSACQYLLNGLDNTRNWYYSQMGKTFSFLDKAIVITSSATANDWNNFAIVTDVPDQVKAPAGNMVPNPNDPLPGEINRWVLLNRSANTLHNAFGNINGQGRIICIAPYTGLGTAASGAGAATSDFIAAQPPAILEFDPKHFPDQHKIDGVTYALGHELGHAFGLGHSCTVFPGNPNCGYSMMENPSNNFGKAILLNEEKTILGSSPFFR